MRHCDGLHSLGLLMATVRFVGLNYKYKNIFNSTPERTYSLHDVFTGDEAGLNINLKMTTTLSTLVFQKINFSFLSNSYCLHFRNNKHLISPNILRMKMIPIAARMERPTSLPDC